MGLDMYLSVRMYVGGWKHSSPAEKAKFEKLVEAAGIRPIQDSPSFYVEATVGYWRKANAIHAWFVKNVQGGRDECQSSYVSREQLGELRAACKQVLDTVETVPGTLKNGSTHYPDGRVEQHTTPGEVIAQAGVAAAVLPTQSGFFFGSTDYDQYYLDDLRDTVAIIDRALDLPDSFDFIYRASW